MKITHRNPTLSEYNELRQMAGWPLLDPAITTKGISNSIFSIVVEDDQGTLVGMGRLVGDGAIYLHIQDIIVSPDYRNRGIGKTIMNTLLEHIDGLGGKNTYIGLMSSKGREAFYKQFGFNERPNDKQGAGMTKIKEK
ncbi:MAG: GNAT family N-acetyltransferase [Chryseolinea sp.]